MMWVFVGNRPYHLENCARDLKLFVFQNMNVDMPHIGKRTNSVMQCIFLNYIYMAAFACSITRNLFRIASSARKLKLSALIFGQQSPLLHVIQKDDALEQPHTGEDIENSSFSRQGRYNELQCRQ